MNARTGAYANGQEIVYLDNAATTFPKPEIVHEFANDFYRRFGGNAGRGNNPMARACARLLDETRSKCAAWLGAPSADQVIFTASATHSLNLAILGHDFRRDDIVYVSPFEHNSVLRPLEHLRLSKGIQIREIPFDSRTHTCKLEELQIAFQYEPPAMVCVTHASNVTGIMPPVSDIARLARHANENVVVVVDGAQTAGLYELPLGEGLIDALIFSGHKSFYASYGIAGVVLGTSWRPKLLYFGGTGTNSESVQMPTHLPSAYEAGSHNIWAVAALNAAVDWLNSLGRAAIVNHTIEMARELRQILAKYDTIKLYGPSKTELSSGIISFNVEGFQPQAIENLLGARGIAVRAGLHCAPWTHRWLSTNSTGGTIRMSPGYFQTTDDINRVGELLGEVLGDHV